MVGFNRLYRSTVALCVFVPFGVRDLSCLALDLSELRARLREYGSGGRPMCVKH